MAIETEAAQADQPTLPRVPLLADDIWDMPDDGKRYEVIEGRLYVTTAPDLDHQEPSVNISGYIWQYLQQHPIGKIYTAPVGLILDEHNGLQPDLVYVSRERRHILTRRGIRGETERRLVAQRVQRQPAELGDRLEQRQREIPRDAEDAFDAVVDHALQQGVGKSHVVSVVGQGANGATAAT